ncbi:hypothetical protein OE903_08815 [Bacillus sp. B6(2022)]|nr:hypothetical protein [Bacillus sp. B6(2022)]
MNSLFELDQQLIELQYEASSSEEVTAYLAERLETGGYIKSSFYQQCLKEKNISDRSSSCDLWGGHSPYRS